MHFGIATKQTVRKEPSEELTRTIGLHIRGKRSVSFIASTPTSAAAGAVTGNATDVQCLSEPRQRRNAKMALAKIGFPDEAC